MRAPVFLVSGKRMPSPEVPYEPSVVYDVILEGIVVGADIHQGTQFLRIFQFVNKNENKDIVVLKAGIVEVTELISYRGAQVAECGTTCGVAVTSGICEFIEVECLLAGEGVLPERYRVI